MPVPSPRSKLLPARGNYADLAANVAELLDGEICYAYDEDQYYQKESSVLVAVGATKAQGLLADSALQDSPSDGSQYVRQDGAWEIAAGGGLGDAPSDGTQYARQDGSWTAVTGGGGTAATLIAPFSIGLIDSASAGTGTGATWGAYNSGDGSISVTFDSAQPDTDYIVYTDNEAFDDTYASVSNKTTSGFTLSQYDTNGNATSPATRPLAFQVFASDPTVTVGGTGAAVIDDLADVDTSTVAPTDGQALVWDNAAGLWEPGTVSSGGGGSSATVFNVTADGTTAYLFDGDGFSAPTPNPDIVLYRGNTYEFNNTSGAHPFQIEENGVPYSTGVTGNNTVGTVTFVVPYDAPQALSYQCTAHPAMTGLLSIATARPVIDENYDVDASSPTQGQSLIYNADTSKWEAGNPDPGIVSKTITDTSIKIAQDFEAYGTHSGEKEADTWSDGQSAQGVGKTGDYCLDHSVTPGTGFNSPWTSVNEGPIYVEFWYRHDEATDADQRQHIFGIGYSGGSTGTDLGGGGFVIEQDMDSFSLTQVNPDGYLNEAEYASLILRDGSDPDLSKYLVSSGPGNIADDQWHHIVFMQETIENPLSNSSSLGIFRCYVDGKLVDTYDRSVANGGSGPIDTNAGSLDRAYVGARKDGTLPFLGKLDNFVVYTDPDQFPYTPGRDYVDPYEGPVNTTRTFQEQLKGGPSTALSDFSGIPPTSSGETPVFDGVKYVPTYTLRVGASDTTGLNLRYPFSSNDNNGFANSDLTPGLCIIDAFNGKIAVWTGPWNALDGVGGWMEITINQIFGA